MNKEVSNLSRASLPSPTQEIITPLSTRTLFWRARYLSSSAFLCHVPFLFWLIETCRPKRFVELGVGEGVSYFAACQAIDKLDLDARCHGIATRGAQTSIPESIRRYNTQHYGDFSLLHAEDLRDVVRKFADGSIDLLHVDIDPQEESILDCLSHDWTRKLSPQGVLLLHGFTSRFSDGHARNYLDHLVDSYPSITLGGGDGLTAVLYGEKRHERLVKLADLTFGKAGYSEVHQVFSRLGATHSFEWSSRIEAERAAEANKKRELSEKELQKSEKQCEALQKKVGALDSAYDARTEQIATLQGKVFDFQADHEKREVETSALRHRLDEKQAEQAEAIAMRDAALADSQRAFEDQTRELNKLKAQMSTRLDEIANLTKMLETKEEEKVAALAVAEKARQEDAAEKLDTIAKLTAERDADRAGLGSLHAALKKVHAEQAETIGGRDAALADNQRVIKDQASELNKLKAQMSTRFNEIATLTKMLETREKDMPRLQKELDNVRHHRNALLNSTSWKLTYPARRVLDTLRR